MPGPEFEEKAPQAGPLARCERGEERLLLGRGLDLHDTHNSRGPGVTKLMLEHRFNGPPFTIGVEEELMILEADGFGLAHEIEAILAAVPPEFDGQVKPELMQSVLEIATKPCRNVQEA